jgi:hypothetical protein
MFDAINASGRQVASLGNAAIALHHPRAQPIRHARHRELGARHGDFGASSRAVGPSATGIEEEYRGHRVSVSRSVLSASVRS